MEHEPLTGAPRRGFRIGGAWTTVADLKALVTLALPMVVVQLGLMLMGVVDTILVGHVSAADLAATALGNLYVFGLVAMGMGTLMALDPVVAQAVGAGDPPAIARAVQRGLLLALAITIPTTLLFLPAEWLFRVLGQPDDVVPRAAAFVRASMPGVVPFLAFVVLRQSLQAMGHMRPIVTLIVAANVVNGLLCWTFVYGHAGEQWRGAAGAGLATTCARWFMALGLLALAWRDLEPSLIPLRREALDLVPLRRMLRIGIPIGVQYQLEFGVFAVVALFMGRLGTIPMAAHQVAINLASLTFMVPLGVSGAAAVRVGRAVGAGDPDSARRAARAALVLGASFMALSGLTLAAFAAPFARVYSSDVAVVALAASLIPIAGVFQVFDGLQVVSLGVLRGVGDTRAPMLVNVLGFWLLGFPASLALGFGLGGGAQGLWWGLVVGLAAVAVFLVLRVRSRLSRSLERLVIDEHPA